MLTINLEDTYPGQMISKDDFTAVLVSRDDPEFTRPLYVMSVNAADKSLRIKFPGAESGNYNIFLIGEGVGRIDKTPLALTVTSQVSGISPLAGSALGGTMVTIDGINFSDDKLDNPVKVGDYWCFVKETSATQIKCRVMETGTEEITTVQVITFLRTSEEAINLVDNKFEYMTPVATVNSISSDFDAATNTAVLTLEGEGFGTDASGIELFIDGELQTALTADETRATFTLDSALDETSNDVKIYFPDGLPLGYEDVSSVTVTPTLVSVSPSSGSYGGTLITVTGTGFGINTDGLQVLHEASGEEICDEVNAIDYGVFTCLTKAMEITSSDSLKLVTSSGSYACGNINTPSECFFEQAQASSPSVSGASITSSSTIEITGSAFPTSDYDAIVVFMGVESSSAVINDDSSIVATFSNGIPLTAAGSEAPSIRFVPSSERRRLISLVDASMQLIASITGITLDNKLALSDSTSGLSCSFQGGCPYEVTAPGLSASLLDSESNYIEVCGNKCEIDASKSNADTATCSLPLVSTAFSASTYEIVTQGKIHDGTWTGTASDEELAKLIDGKNMIDMIDETASDCYF